MASSPSTCANRSASSVGRILTGNDLDQMSDPQLDAALPETTIFARVTPGQKSRVIVRQRALGSDVGFLGDGVNDAIALHKADIGISVDSGCRGRQGRGRRGADDKDLDILADGVAEGRRMFANTIKYVLMGTSSNFGNMFSAAGASLFLSFLPMLPTQILLNNLLYDVSELTIPTDNVDEELLARPSQWDIGMIRRFMGFFGPISSLYDFLTFAVMLKVFDAGPTLFRSGWFVESLATQTLVIFVIRTRRVPFFRSRPSRRCSSPPSAARRRGRDPVHPVHRRAAGIHQLPPAFLAVLAVMVTYLALAELGKSIFFKPRAAVPSPRPSALISDASPAEPHAGTFGHTPRRRHHPQRDPPPPKTRTRAEPRSGNTPTSLHPSDPYAVDVSDRGDKHGGDDEKDSQHGSRCRDRDPWAPPGRKAAHRRDSRGARGAEHEHYVSAGTTATKASSTQAATQRSAKQRPALARARLASATA